MPLTARQQLEAEYRVALQEVLTPGGGASIEDVAVSTNEIRDRGIDQGIEWYSRRAPQIVTALVASVGGGFYAVPTDWATGSRIVSIEFPLDQSPPIYLPPRSVQFQRRESGLFYYLAPNPSGSFRLTYTAAHKLDATTIRTDHLPLVGRMAVAVAAMEFVAKFGHTVANNVDSINYRTKADEWGGIYTKLRKEIDLELGRDERAQVYVTDPDTVGKGSR